MSQQQIVLSDKDAAQNGNDYILPYMFVDIGDGSLWSVVGGTGVQNSVRLRRHSVQT